MHRTFDLLLSVGQMSEILYYYGHLSCRSNVRRSDGVTPFLLSISKHSKAYKYLGGHAGSNHV